ncbi:capsular exopolysaccharide synthesis family protein [Paenibacillus sp. V4I3]|uniref:CpsD/CapB family tyrosine-protein kinase n=1 Tax=unclassified Paenibacillus TaxID=185978 RepID=UPI00277DF931|nr:MULTISPECIES: CpsD/CapB family tyrosine-protein kinase [unclassified Paenibacillus]MDQ0873197.1 capsular exopolysaccharide synthesis family protein [Paenibacillus sp. V4I3]MDQ0890886.1 capsular exopolysaccharide synthesis family protein [Paenibacillus sp. V4I9]
MLRQNHSFHLITHVNPSSYISENYRDIRTNLTYSTLDGACKTVLVTSATAGEGKSTVLSNLAVAYAHVGKKVLMIDADLRKPALHHIFSNTNELGLVQALENSALLKQSIKETMIPNLYLLPSGPIPLYSSELLTNGMSNLLHELKTHFDLIFIDSPPVLTVTDTQIIAAGSDGVILVIRNGKIKRQLAKKAVDKLKFVKANIVGSILNYTISYG